MNIKDNEPKSDLDSLEKDSSNHLENDSSLEALVLEEQSLVRQKLLEDLGREPTQTEIDKWLSEQTEGY